MPHEAPVGDRLIILSLTLEAAVRDENWAEVAELLDARSAVLDAQPKLSKQVVDELSAIDERMLTSLRHRLAAVKGDMRNLSAALRISNPYGRQRTQASVSLAG